MTAIEMNEVCPRVIADAAILQFQRNPPDFTQTDSGNKEVDCLSLDVEAVPCGTAASFHQQGVIFRRSVGGDHVDFSLSAKRFLHQVDVFDDPRIDCGDFSRMVTAENVVEIIQRRQIVPSAIVAVPHA